MKITRKWRIVIAAGPRFDLVVGCDTGGHGKKVVHVPPHVTTVQSGQWDLPLFDAAMVRRLPVTRAEIANASDGPRGRRRQCLRDRRDVCRRPPGPGPSWSGEVGM